MKGKTYNFILISAILCQQLGYVFSSGIYPIKDAWYICNAFTHVILWYTLINPKKNIYTPHICKMGLILAGSQFLDEFIGDPTKLGWNEVVVTSIVALWSIYFYISSTPKYKSR